MDKIEKHLKALKEKHAELDVKLAEEEARPLPDSLKIQEYKKQKLAVKQEIEAIENK
ncbi:MAG: YdcH family protein [Alphaproteobacteria bacterium]|nr:YdcH family protein [Alphaproteobacteria bacterium]